MLAARWADHVTYPASSIKVVHLLHAIQHTGGGDQGLAFAIPVYGDSCRETGFVELTPLTQLLDATMLESDNDAANSIQTWFGTDALNQTVAAANGSGSE